jgi:hypothetical protein
VPVARVLNVEKIENKLKVALNKLISSKELLDKVGEFSRERIYSFAKTGKSLFGDTPEKFMKLSDVYMRYRAKLEKIAQMGDHFAPRRSNLTLTGQMLNALTWRTKKNEVEVFVKPTARNDEPKLTQRPRNGPRLNNAQVAEDLAKRGRRFIGMDRLGRERIKKLVIKELRQALRSSRLHK